MNNLPEPTNNQQEILTAAGQKIYSAGKEAPARIHCIKENFAA